MSKKNRNIVVAVIILAGLLSIMIFSNSKSDFVRQLQGPIEGTDSVITVDGRLSIVSKENHIYTWQWKELTLWPVVAKPQSQALAPIAGDKVIYDASAGIGKLIITNLKADKELASLSLPYGAECKKIKTSSNGKFGVVSMLLKDGAQKDWLKLAIFNSDLKDLLFIFQKDTKAEDFSLYDFVITDDGKLLAGAGKKGKAWIFVTDIKNEKILWERTFDEYDQFTFLAFSPDGRTLYVTEKVRYIIALDSATGNTIRVYEIPIYATPSNQKENVSCIAISPDGKILAADTEPACDVWYWDLNTGKKIASFQASEFTVSDIAFSPDSKYLATGCLVTPEIKIWKVPQPK
jgi:WD40 repeat protein